MGFTAADLPDLAGTTAVVTGANSGIGYVAARELARHGAAVTLACRNTDKAAAARAKILADVPNADVAVARLELTLLESVRDFAVGRLDLSRLESVRDFAGGWNRPLDLLINNAGLMAPLQRRTTPDGFELQMGTNHLGHFALTGLLLPALLAVSRPRVVTVSSLAHSFGALDLDDLQSVAGYTPQRSYGN
jgi:NAD(P)-dependent dehydrogenase (short-subunit alcohol dehydrogenase family)